MSYTNIMIDIKCGQPWRREQKPTPIFLPRESHGQRSLVNSSLWGCKELDTTEQLTHCGQPTASILMLSTIYCMLEGVMKSAEYFIFIMSNT